jgi:hypothetical protein
MQAVSKRKEQPSGHRVVLSLSDGQKDKFKKAWQSLGENEATSIVYKAVLNAAKEILLFIGVPIMSAQLHIERGYYAGLEFLGKLRLLVAQIFTSE